MFLSSHGGSQPPRWSFHSQRTGGPTLQLPERHRKWTLGTPLWQSPQSPGTSRRQESTLRVRHNGTHLSALNLKPHLFCSAGKHQGSQDAISGRDLGGNSVLTNKAELKTSDFSAELASAFPYFGSWPAPANHSDLQMTLAALRDLPRKGFELSDSFLAWALACECVSLQFLTLKDKPTTVEI